ncbi:MAG: TIGR04053 family radical SAM/SPASM domain-containing protein [Actinobacteria bacterium]|nr:TIGR04053 family radical SAM/SPASM domain-containing protein [Actinomycetota bacterium]
MTAVDRLPVRTLHQNVDERPFIVIWEVTRACGLVCAHCRADARLHRDPLELTTTEGKQLFDELAAYGAPRPVVVLTGGDPFERPDLVELVRYGTKAGLHIALSPSVTSRFSRGVVAELREAGAMAMSLSLDGSSAATHDGFRGVPGVYDATLEAAADVIEVGCRLQINTTVTAANVLELPAILRKVIDLKAGLWSVFFLVSTGRATTMSSLSPDDVEEVLHWLHDVSDLVAIKATEAPHYRRIAIQRALADDVEAEFPPGELRRRLRAATSALIGPADQRRRPRPSLDVNAGRGFAFVDHVGRVHPSGFLPIPVGSVREQRFAEIYRNAPLMRALRDPDGFGGRCGRCQYRHHCGGSRSRAFAAHGDPLAEDPTCSFETL